MKTSVAATVLERGGLAGEKSFGIVFDAKMAKILSSQLYSDSVTAIIRELSCNAYDAHIQGGNSDEPFEVHLPNSLEPWFSVQDWGVGLNPQQISDVYTVYGCSTKTESNDVIGQLGLGSKSPFSYTDAFVVTSVQNGIKHTYSMFKDELGMSNCAALGTGEKTTERNGVRVEIPVNKYDFNEFNQKAARVFKWFEKPPRIVGRSDFKIPSKTARFSGTDWSILDCESQAVALMGNVAYQIRENDLSNLTNKQRCMLALGPMLKFNIGDLEVSASRESLSYDARTINNILSKLNVMHDEFSKIIEAKFQECNSLWEAKTLLQHMSYYIRQALGRNHVFSWRGVTFHTEYVGFNIKSFYTVDQIKTGKMVRILNPYSDKSYNVAEKINVVCDNTTVFVFDDLRQGIITRLLHYRAAANNNNKYVIIRPSDTKTQEEFLKELGNPPASQILLASTLPKAPVQTRSSNDSVYLYENWKKGLENGSIEDTELDLENGGFYIPTSRWQVSVITTKNEAMVDAAGKPVVENGIPKTKKVDVYNKHPFINNDSIREVLSHAVALGILPSDVKVYTSKGQSRRLMLNHSKWINVIDHVQNALMAFDKQILAREIHELQVLQENISDKFVKVLSYSTRLKNLDPNISLMGKYATKLREMEKYYYENSQVKLRIDKMIVLMKMLDPKSVDTITSMVLTKHELAVLRQQLTTTYPMIFKLTDTWRIQWQEKTICDTIADYVDLIDSTTAKMPLAQRQVA